MSFSCLSFILVMSVLTPKPPLAALLSKEKFEQSFPHHNPLYTYEALIKAAESFPTFAGEGDQKTRLREIAAFFAHIAHETTNGWSGAKGGPYVWGLYYIEEQACKDGHCTQYNTGGNSPYKPASGKSYYGRGPLQLTYAYNYGQAGQDLDLPLLARPEIISKDGVIAFRTALWFWMKTQTPKPSCHDAITGKWQPTAADQAAKRKPGFGMTINIINGGLECKPGSPAGSRNERIGFYKHMAALLGSIIEENCDCVGMATYGN